MKRIVCDLCDGTDFLKEGGIFICQGCGTKYTLEEAKGMMREVAGDAPAPVQAAPVQIPVVNPNQAQLDNILILATTAYEADNYTEAETYCNRAIELDATNSKAWFLKGKTVGWSSKMDKLRFEEAAHSFCKAIDFAPEEEKEDTKNQAVDQLKRLGLAAISTRKDRFASSPKDDELNGFKNDRKALLSALTVLLNHGNAVGMPDGYLDEIAVMMNRSAVAALTFIRKAWKDVEWPTDNDLTTYIEWLGNVESLIRESIDANDEDDESDIVRYENLKIVLEEPIGVWSYKKHWNGSYYEHVRSRSLSDEAVKYRHEQMAKCDVRIAQIKRSVQEKKAAAVKKAAEDKAARIKAYWEAHAEEKVSLEAEQRDLEDKCRELEKSIDSLDEKIKALTPSDPVPSALESAQIQNQIRDLEARRAKLGLFAGKEKKQITEEIASLSGRMDMLKSKILKEETARRQETEQKTAPLSSEQQELKAQLEKSKKRITAIAHELTKDPEE